MKKKYFSFPSARMCSQIALLALSESMVNNPCMAQVGVNSSGNAPHSSSMLDVQANDRGMLIPRMTTSERDAIVSPADFLQIINTTTRCFEAYNANFQIWEQTFCFCSAPSSPLATSATNVTNESFDANWNAAAGATVYYLDVALDAGFTNLVVSNQNVGNVTAFPVSGVDCETTYYYRVRAANTCGTSSSSSPVSQLLDPCGPVCPPTVTDIDGNIYNTTVIGMQCWMASSLNTTKDASGNSITRYCNNCSVYGGLYTWSTTMNGASSTNLSPSGVQGICPTDWHVPSHDEWTTMERALCTSGSCVTDFPYDTFTDGNRGTNEGAKMKASPGDIPSWDGNNSSGFKALPSGVWYSGGIIWPTETHFWSTTENGSNAWFRIVSSGDSGINRLDRDKTRGLSVRCVHD